MFWQPTFGLFGFLVPFLFIFFGVRILRHFLGNSRGTNRYTLDDERDASLPYDDFTVRSRYPEHTESIPSESIETKIFRLADDLKGRVTVSDIVIGTNLGLKEAEEAIDALVDGVHVTMEVSDSGRVIYEFPEIIARHEQDDSTG